jgi:ankyrin repeat protein
MMASPTPDQIREFVIAGHGNLPKVQAMLAENPALLNLAYAWSEGDHETALQAAAHVGSVPVAEFLLAQGAPLAIPTAAMLGRQAEVARRLDEDPHQIEALGAHGIPLLPHAALSGAVPLVQMLFERGARSGVSFALSNAVTQGHLELTRWLLQNARPDLGWKNWQDKTALAIAVELGHTELADLLRGHGAAE